MFANEAAAMVTRVLMKRQTLHGFVLLCMMSRQGLLNVGQKALWGTHGGLNATEDSCSVASCPDASSPVVLQVFGPSQVFCCAVF